MIKCVIIDDEQPAINVIKSHIKRIPILKLVGTATSPLAGIKLVRSQNADLVFLDIQMDEMNGIDVMNQIGKQTKIIFCTAYSEFAVTSYEMEAEDFLMKPILFTRFQRAVNRVAEKLSFPYSMPRERIIPNDYIFIKSENKGKMIKINLEDIDYIEAKNNYVAFHRLTNKTMANLRLRDLENQLPRSLFIRVHKSYIVPFTKITAIENGELSIKNCPEQIPLGNNYKNMFMDRMREKFLL